MASISEVNREGSGSPKPPVVTGAGGAAPPSFGDRLKGYFSELRFEWKKITFPTRKELQQSTVVVFVFTLLLMAIISFLDLIISYIFKTLILPPA